MRVLYIIDSLAPGGTETSLAALAPEYAQLGVHLDVAYLFERPGLHEELRAAGARLFRLRGGSRLARARNARTLIRERRPDLVHTSLFEADLVGRIGAWTCRIPVISSLVNESYGPEHYRDPNVKPAKLRIAQVLDAASARLTTRMHAVSAGVADVMARRLQYPRSRIDVVSRGRNPLVLGRRTAERRLRTRAGLGLTDSETMILAVGRQEHQKAFDVALEAVPMIQRSREDTRLFIAGREGSASAGLATRIDDLNLRGRVVTMGQRSDIADLLCAADVYVSTSRREGMPGAVIEAMALETPIVATDIPPTREVTGADAAILVPADDPRALATGILSALGEPARTSQRVDEAYRRFTCLFTIQRSALEMVNMYARVVEATRVQPTR